MSNNCEELKNQVVRLNNYADSLSALMGDALISLSSTGEILHVNKTACDLLEYTEEELIGRPFQLIVFNRHEGENRGEQIICSIKKKLVTDLNITYITKKGEHVPVLFSGQGLSETYEEKTDSTVAIVTIARDMRFIYSIQENRKTIKAQLESWPEKLEKKVGVRVKELIDSQRAVLNIMEDFQEVNELLEVNTKNFFNIIDKAVDPIVIVGKENIILFANPAAEIFLTDSRRTITGELFGYPFTPGVKSEISPPLTADENRIGELDVRETTWEGKEAYMVRIADITERKKIDTAKDEFVSTVSHELRTPLTILKESIELILDEVVGELGEKQKNILLTSQNSIKRLSNLINNLLDISKIEAGKYELQKSFIDIVQLLHCSIEEFTLWASQKNITITYQGHSGKLTVFADPEKLTEVVTNFLSNAIKFTKKDGTIVIHCSDNIDYVQVCVEDNGIGIPEENLCYLFDKFTQFGRKPGPGMKGTGLGLAISKSIIAMHQGEINVESEVNKGSKFCFHFPKIRYQK